MTGVNILLAFVGLLGFLPLAIFLYRKKKADRILANGWTINARVFHITSGLKGNYEIVHYYFLAPDGKQYQGSLSTSPGAYKINNSIEVYYLPDNPKHNTVKGAWKSTGFLIFMIVIAVAVLFMVYKLYEMLEGKEINFR